MTASPTPTSDQKGIEPRGWPAEIQAIEESLSDAPFLDVFKDGVSKSIIFEYVRSVVADDSQWDKLSQSVVGEKNFRSHAIRLGLASLSAFLQANVTGPVLQGTDISDAAFASSYEELCPPPQGQGTANGVSAQTSPVGSFRKAALRSLDTDGVSVYPYIPHIELFGLAHFIFTAGTILPVVPPEAWEANSDDTLASDLAWTRLRIYLWHYRLITQPSLGSGSLYTKSGRWTDVATLQAVIENSLSEAEAAISTMLGSDEGTRDLSWSRQTKTQFYLEKTNAHLMLGNDKEARQALQAATASSGFVYALSGALGKRTRYQEKDISQLVVLAKSMQLSDANGEEKRSSEDVPAALALNDDTLLENIDFNKNDDTAESNSILPEQLRGMSPDDQPRLKAEDHIILLTEATIRDTFSPSDALTSEEILPFAVRVINDKSTNWQVYTQALLVRSRIEFHRSRTLERAILQMQAVVDQVVVDTEASPLPTSHATTAEQKGLNGESGIPSIEVTGTNGNSAGATAPHKPTSFLPAPKPNETASAHERLRYVNTLAAPPRWHLESELAHAWASVGSLVSATEIFKRLRLWAEVALCLATNAASDEDGDGRGSGGEEKARAIIRWRLFHRTGSSAGSKEDDADLDDADVDISSLKSSDFQGPERTPAPPNAPRLFCILGDLEDNAAHYERAWEISNQRFARAQKSLGELYLRNKEWMKARDAYAAAVAVNRFSPEMWSRLGDIELRLGHFPDAAEAFQRAISSSNGTEGGEDARTWSNLGSALLSWYREVAEENKARKERLRNGEVDAEDEEHEEQEVDEDGTTTTTTVKKVVAVDEGQMPSTARAARLGKRPKRLLQDALEAFKRGASVADSNWRIWDNVVTLAASLSPRPALDDVLLGSRNVLRIRATEDALDLDILTLLVREVTGTPAPAGDEEGAGVYEPKRATLERKVVDFFEQDVVPRLTARSEPWSLVSRLRAWRRDWSGALDAAEKGWRAAVAGAGVGVAGGGGGGSSALSVETTPSTTSSTSGNGDWLQDAGAWDTVVQRTAELVAAYENYGDRTEAVGPNRWRGKARMSVRSVMSKGREAWEGSEGWSVLEGLLEALKA